ncbi:MAG: CBS domain-containing protein [Candidatus Thorarchaeota archaeon]|nr:CBS domain-containing protein [Candidatus Thorarchaeota archaeon]
MILTTKDLKDLRLRFGLTQAELATEIGVTQSYIARLEKGSIDPKLSIVKKIVDLLTGRTGKICSEIMSPEPVTIAARDVVSTAVSLMQENNYSQLPVLRGTQVVGIITEWDIIQNLQHNLHEISVQAVMSPSGAIMVDENTSVDVIIPLFENYQAVLVQNQGRLQGIITRSDLLKLI